MDWGDIFVKIGVGACLGFGFITLVKLTTKKNNQDQRKGENSSVLKQGSAERDNEGSNK